MYGGALARVCWCLVCVFSLWYGGSQQQARCLSFRLLQFTFEVNQWWMLPSPIFGFSSLSHILVSFTLISQLVGYGLLFSIASVRPVCCSCACFYGVGDSILRLVPPFHVVQWCALLLSLDRLVAASSLVWNCSLGFPASLLAPCRVSLRFTCNRISLLLQSWLAR
jgi:hypothetical protein